MHAHTADIGGCFQLRAEIIAPLLLGAPNNQACITGLGDQLHAAVAAHVVKRLCETVLVTQHDQ